MFHVIPANTKIAFVANRWRFIGISIVLILLSAAFMAYNQVSTGSLLNFGIDFAGGSQVRLQFAEGKLPPIDDIRTALPELGYAGSSAVTVPDADNEILVRVKDTISISEDQVAACQEAAQQIGDAKLLDFTHPTAGSKLFLEYDTQPNYRDIEETLNAAGCTGKADKGFGGADEFPVEVSLIGIGAKIKDQLNDKFGAGTVIDIVHSETVGAKVGGQLKVDGVKSMLYAIGFIFLYVMLRFDLRFAPGGIVALAHDAFIVIGAFAITGKEFNLQTVAAVLTVIGYSINDTIVVFDRIRERVALHRDEPIEETTDQALNDTLSRTILTSGTTLVVVLSVFFLGSGSIKDFAFALIIGVLVGTYSSLYIASPVFLWVNRKFYEGKGHLRWLDEKDKEGTGTLLAPRREEVDDLTGKSVGQMRDERAGVKPEDEEAAGEIAEGEEAAPAPEPEDPSKKKATRRRRRRPRPEPSD